MTRWNLAIPEETDRSVRTFLACNGRPVPLDFDGDLCRSLLTLIPQCRRATG